MSLRKEFETIYAKNVWGNGSGSGSTPKYCAKYLEYLSSILPHYKNVLDLGCGDWQLYENFDWPDYIRYTGVDVVRKVITNNTADHLEHEFIQCDFTEPSALLSLFEQPRELVLLKDVAQHWSDNELHLWLDTMLKLPFETIIAVNNWRYVRSPEKNHKPRDVNNRYRWAPVDFRKYGFTDVLYYPNGKFKQVCRLDKKDAKRAHKLLSIKDML